MVDDEDAVKDSHTEQGYEPHTGRDAERKAAHPQRGDAANERQGHCGEHHKRVGDALEGEEQQQQDEHQRYRDDDHEGADGILQILKLPAILEVVAWLQLDVLLESAAYIVHYLLYIGIADIDTDNDAAFGRVTVYLQRAADKVNRGHLADRYLHAVACPHGKGVEVKVLDKLVVEPHDEVEAPLVLEHHTCRLAGVGCAYDGVQLLYVYPVAGYLRAVIVDDELWQTDSLLHNHVCRARHFTYQRSRLLGL